MEKERKREAGKARAQAKAKAIARAQIKAKAKENRIPNQGQIPDALKTPVVAKIAAEIADVLMIKGHVIKEMRVLTLVVAKPCLVEFALLGSLLFGPCLARRRIVEKKIVDKYLAACERSHCYFYDFFQAACKR